MKSKSSPVALRVTSIPKPVLAAALGLLQAYAPELTATTLVEALHPPETGAPRGTATAVDLQLLTVADVCRLSGLCKLTIHRLAKSGRLPVVRFGRRVRVRRTDWEALCRAGGTGTATKKAGPARE